MTAEAALRKARRALLLADAADLDHWADIGPCPVYHGDAPDECICSEEARRLIVRDAFKTALADVDAALANMSSLEK